MTLRVSPVSVTTHSFHVFFSVAFLAFAAISFMLIYRICKNIENKMLPLYDTTIILTDSESYIDRPLSDILIMPQEFNILRCYSCQLFQVHFVKKETKWSCKVCSEKQSLKQVFFRWIF